MQWGSGAERGYMPEEALLVAVHTIAFVDALVLSLDHEGQREHEDSSADSGEWFCG